MKSGVLFFLLGALAAAAQSVTFMVDPNIFDTNPMDGQITGTEFLTSGSDGTLWAFVPTDNLVGGDRFLLSETSGLQYGGGGGLPSVLTLP